MQACMHAWLNIPYRREQTDRDFSATTGPHLLPDKWNPHDNSLPAVGIRKMFTLEKEKKRFVVLQIEYTQQEQSLPIYQWSSCSPYYDPIFYLGTNHCSGNCREDTDSGIRDCRNRVYLDDAALEPAKMKCSNSLTSRIGLVLERTVRLVSLQRRSSTPPSGVFGGNGRDRSSMRSLSICVLMDRF